MFALPASVWLAVSLAFSQAVPGNAGLAAIYADGLAMKAQDPHEAAVRFRAVWQADPTFTPALIELGLALEAQGEPQEALLAYAQAPYEVDVLEQRARLLLAVGRDAEAAEAYQKLQSLAEPDKGAPYYVGEARAVVRTDPQAALATLVRFVDRPDAVWKVADDDPRGAAIGDLYPLLAAVAAGIGPADRAAFLALVERVLLLQGAAEDPRAVGLRDEVSARELADRLAAADPEALSDAEAARLDRALAAAGSGDHAAALRDLRVLVDGKPKNPDAQGALGEALAATGDVGAAENAWRRAMALDPLNPAHPTHLAELLRDRYGGRRDAEAAQFARLAQLLDPEDPARWALVADLAAREADPTVRAAEIAAWREYLLRAPSGADAERARQIVADWDRVPPLPPDAPVVDRRPADVPVAAWENVWLGEAWVLMGHPDRALVAVETALQASPTDAHALALKARVVQVLGGEGARDEAIALYQSSLAARADQPEVLLALADLLRRGGDHAGARGLEEQAAARGSAEAWYRLARADWDAGRPLQARDALDAFFRSPSSDRLPEARALRDEMSAALARVGILGTGAAAILVGAPLGWWWRRRSGLDLDAFLARSPQSFRDVARIASILKHDVLKHHCAVLDAVADALDDRDPEPARWVADRLYGPSGAVAKFRLHVRQLEDLARLQGLRLNLRHKDPVFGPLIAAMDALEGLESQLRTGHGRRLAADLRAVSAELNGTGPRAISALVRRLCLLPVDPELIEAAWASCSREPAFHGKALPAFTIEAPAERACVRMFREDLTDVLVNLLRNALQASVEAGSTALSVAVRFEEDPTTGLERVALRVRDQAPKRVTTAVIRGRYIERGLGLTVDLISKNGGSIKVEDERGWSKAVVVRFPRVEAADVAS